MTIKNRTMLGLSLDRFEVETFDFGTCPVGFSQESETRLHARIDVEAADIDPVAQFLPAVLVDEVFQHGREGHSVQRVVKLRIVHCDNHLGWIRKDTGCGNGAGECFALTAF